MILYVFVALETLVNNINNSQQQITVADGSYHLNRTSFIRTATAVYDIINVPPPDPT